MTAVDQRDAQGRQDIGFPVRGVGRPREAGGSAQLGGRAVQVAEIPEHRADGLVRDGCLEGGGVGGKDSSRLRKRFPGTSTGQRQQIKYPVGAVPAGARAASHKKIVSPAIRVVHATMGKAKP